MNISRTNNENDDDGGSDDDDDDENDDDGGEKVVSKGGLWQHRRSKELRLSSTLVATAPPTHYHDDDDDIDSDDDLKGQFDFLYWPIRTRFSLAIVSSDRSSVRYSAAVQISQCYVSHSGPIPKYQCNSGPYKDQEHQSRHILVSVCQSVRPPFSIYLT